MLPGGGKGPAYMQLGDVVGEPTEFLLSLQASWHAPQEGQFCSFAPAMLIALYEYKQSQGNTGGLCVHRCCCCCTRVSTPTATPASHLPCDAAQHPKDTHGCSASLILHAIPKHCVSGNTSLPALASRCWRQGVLVGEGGPH